MFYENYPKLCITSLAISLLAYYFSPWEDLRVDVPIVSAQESKAPTKKAQQEFLASLLSGTGYYWHESWTWGIVKSKSWTGKIQWVYKAPKCDVSCKISTLKKLGIRDEIARSIVTNCKELATDPVHCIKVASSIVTAESWGWTNCNGYNCFWMWGWGKKYKSYNDGVKDFVTRYNKYWYKAKSASFFYPSKWGVSPSRYCTSEHSSNSSKGCPNGQRHAQAIWNKIKF